jgi:hypothetical protein
MASDAGYLGHFANDALTCASPYLRDEYEVSKYEGGKKVRGKYEVSTR